MFHGEQLSRPQLRSLVLCVLVAFCAYGAALTSAYAGYGLAILTMLLLGLQAFAAVTIWPTKKKRENTFFFALYWGLILGLVVPYLVENLMMSDFWE